MAGGRFSTPADELIRAAAMNRASGQPLPMGVPGGGGRPATLSAEEREMLNRIILAMGRRQGTRLPPV